jgi:hypothetical protein
MDILPPLNWSALDSWLLLSSLTGLALHRAGKGISFIGFSRNMLDIETNRDLFD